MSAISSTRWFWSDWLGDAAVRRLTPAERGIWIDLLALASVGNPTGYVCDSKGTPLTLGEIARVCNASADEVEKLITAIEEKGAASRDRAGRLFNRRMVRDTKLTAKRSKAGKVGAAHTNLINQQLRAEYKILPQQVTRQKSRGPPPPLPNKERNLSSENSAARARNGGAMENSQTAGSLATAPLDGALTRPPNAGVSHGKRPDEANRDDLEAGYARKRAANGKTSETE